jgi:hypothetical protein
MRRGLPPLLLAGAAQEVREVLPPCPQPLGPEGRAREEVHQRCGRGLAGGLLVVVVMMMMRARALALALVLLLGPEREAQGDERGGELMQPEEATADEAQEEAAEEMQQRLPPEGGGGLCRGHNGRGGRAEGRHETTHEWRVCQTLDQHAGFGHQGHASEGTGLRGGGWWPDMRGRGACVL